MLSVRVKDIIIEHCKSYAHSYNNGAPVFCRKFNEKNPFPLRFAT